MNMRHEWLRVNVPVCGPCHSSLLAVNDKVVSSLVEDRVTTVGTYHGAILAHSFEGSLKIVSDQLSGEVCPRLQLHRAAGTLRHTGIQGPLDVVRVVRAVPLWNRDNRIRLLRRLCLRPRRTNQTGEKNQH